MSHRYEAAKFSAAKWLRERQERPGLEVLLVVDPTKDLAGARMEGERIKKVFEKMGAGISYRLLFQDQARRTELLSCFSSGKYDIVHYAGHAFFDPTVRAQSGLLCAGHEVLSGADLAGIGNLPPLMFFNACESARVRKMTREANKPPPKSAENISRDIGFAEALLRGGVANYLGTYWPVGDSAAKDFAGAFYEQVLNGAPLNRAILEGRKAVESSGSRDWADYVFYGDADFQVKIASASRGAA
jgi:CHAT domain-containing protein